MHAIPFGHRKQSAAILCGPETTQQKNDIKDPAFKLRFEVIS